MTKTTVPISRSGCVRPVMAILLLLASASALEAQTVTVMWDPNSESNLAGYVLKYGTQSGVYSVSIDVGNQTSRQVSLTSGVTYYFVIQAYNTSNLFSPFSAQVSFNSGSSNSPPTLTDPPNQTSAAASFVSLQLVASDPNGGALTYSAAGLPPSLSVNPTTGLIAGTLAAGSTGTYTVTVTVSDGSLSDSGTFAWTVTSPGSLRDDEVALDFGTSGLWIEDNSGATPWRLHNVNPGAMATADLDGNGRADLIVDFPKLGVWVWLNGASWFQLHTANVASIVTADLDGNGRTDVILDFPGSGIWVWRNNAEWFQLHTMSPTRMVTGDLDGNGKPEVIIDFKRQGIWVWLNNTTWFQLHTSNATSLAAGDLDGGGRAEVLIGFPGQGLWVWRNNASWSQLHTVTPSRLVTGDLDGNGRQEAIIDFKGSGLWVWRNDSAWSQLHSQNAEALTTGDFDGNGQADVFIDFGAPGLWVWVDDGSWIQLDKRNPQGMAIGNLDGK